MLKGCIFQPFMETKFWIKYKKIILHVTVLRLSRGCLKVVNKEFQEEIKQEQGKHYLSEQLWPAWPGEGTLSWKKAFLEKDVHGK